MAERKPAEAEQHADPNREVLEPELVRAVEDLSWHVGQAMQMHELGQTRWAGDQAELHDHALNLAVRGALQFAEAFRDHGDPDWMKIMELTQSAAAEHSQVLRRRQIWDAGA